MPLAWQYNVIVQESLAPNQVDGIALVNRPSQGELLDRMIQKDAINVFPNGNFVDQVTFFDGLRFALGNNVGVGPEVLFLSDRNIMQDAFHNPNILVTQFPRELVVLPTSASIRLTQATRELVVLPTSTNIRLTQMARELVMLYPEAFLAEEDFLMSINDQLFLQDSLLAFNPGKYFLTIGERNSPGMFDQTGADNVKVKKNQIIKAQNLQTPDTTLNHWQEAFVGTVIPGNTVQAFTDNFTLSDALASKLLVTLTEILADQDTTWADTTPTLLAGGLLTFIQTMNNWQEFYAPQPFLGIFAESMQDQWQENLTMFAQYFGNFPEQLVLSEAVGAGYGDLIAESNAMADAMTIAEQLNESITETLSILDAMLLGYGFIILDTESLSDAMLLGYGNIFAESNTMNDSMSSGYGAGMSEQLNMAEAILAGYGDLIAEQMVQLEAWTIGYELRVSDDEEGNWADLFHGLLINAGELFTETINFFSEQVLVGYGILLADQDTTWAENTMLFMVDALMVMESMAQVDSIAAGYGMQPSDQQTLLDQLLLGIGQLMAEQLALADFEQNVVGSPIIVSDALTILDSTMVGYGLVTTDDADSWQDLLTAFSAYGILLSDFDFTWLDNARPISAIEFRTYFVFMRVTADDVKVSKRVTVNNFTTYLVQQ